MFSATYFIVSKPEVLFFNNFLKSGERKNYKSLKVHFW